MEMITDMPAAGEVEQVPASGDTRNIVERPHFNPAQQKAFDRAFARKEGKLRRELEAMRKDLLETVALTGQLLDRCRDRISVEDQRAIRSGLEAIRSEYSKEATSCQKS